VARYPDAITARVRAGHVAYLLFEKTAEEALVQPTFLTDFPLAVSPLARKKESDPAFCDRFELFVAGREIANAFSELNDPADQRARFLAQVRAREAGADETMDYDEDYCRALELGMPPAAGEGIGIDRLTMLLAGQASIRDVILFPLMRPE
jgi:lysyl-tRNA synthetase, class II